MEIEIRGGWDIIEGNLEQFCDPFNPPPDSGDGFAPTPNENAAQPSLQGLAGYGACNGAASHDSLRAGTG